MKKLNAGCGTNRLKGYINSDINPKFKPDVIWDMRIKSKWPNNYFDEILCDNVLEHMIDVMPIMEELHRILKQGGKLIIIVPHFTSVFWAVLDHKRAFSVFTFDRHSKEYKLDISTRVGKHTEESEDITAKFSHVKHYLDFGKGIQKWNYFFEWFANKFPMVYESTMLRNLFPAWRVHFELIK